MINEIFHNFNYHLQVNMVHRHRYLFFTQIPVLAIRDLLVYVGVTGSIMERQFIRKLLAALIAKYIVEIYWF